MKHKALLELPRGKGVLRLTRSGHTIMLQVLNRRGDERGFKPVSQVTLNVAELPEVVQALKAILLTQGGPDNE